MGLNLSYERIKNKAGEIYIEEVCGERGSP